MQASPDPQAPLGSAILALYAAVTDETHWRAVLQRLSADSFRDAGMGILPAEGGAASAIAAGIPASDLEALCPWLSTRALRQGAACSTDPAHGVQYWRLPADAAIEGLSGSHLLIRLVHDDRSIGHADLYRAPGERDFDESETASFLTLAPYLGQALGVAMRLSAAETCARRCAECRDLQSFGCLVLDDSGSIVESNGTARDWLSAGDGLCVRDGRLHAQRAVDDLAMDGKLRAVLAEREPSGAAFVAVSRPSGRRPYFLFFSRIDSSRPAFGVRLPPVRLLIVDANRGSDMPREVLQMLHGLTRTETDVAWHLANGASLEETAKSLGIAHNTARHHLERIFAKTEVRRQSDLVRLTLAPFVSLGRVK